MSITPGSPIRTCIGCRGKTDKAELLRVVRSGAAVVPDPTATAPGRGAYLHPRLDCLECAARSHAFNRALRIKGAAELTQLRAAVSEQPRPHSSRGSTG